MTGDLGEELRRLADSGAERRAELQASGDVVRAVRRRRAVRGGLVAAGAAAGLGLVGAAAAPSVLAAMEPEAEPAPTLSVTDTVVDHATVAFEDAMGPDGLVVLEDGGPAACGGPLPDPVAISGDFSATFTPPHADVLNPDGYSGSSVVKVEVTYTGASDLPAISDPVLALFARDGVVVGYSTSYHEVGLTTWTTGGTTGHTWDSIAWASACGGDEEWLAPGEYEVAWSMRVHASQEENAQMDLAAEGYAVPPAGALEIYAEGSYDCQEALSWGSQVPLTCAPDALFGTEIDGEAGTITFPYSARAYDRDVEATFVSEPRTMTVGSTPGLEWWADFDEAHPLYQPGTAVACGDVLRPASEEDTFRWDVRWDQITAGESHPAVAWRWTQDWSQRTIELPASTRLWLLTNDDVVFEQEDRSQVQTSVPVVAGWAEVTLPSSIQMTRYDGPTEFEVAIDTVEWCDAGRPASGVRPEGVIVDPYVMTDASGTPREVTDPIMVWSDTQW